MPQLPKYNSETEYFPDQDECLHDPDICGEDETCLNMHKTFKCLYTPCGEGFTRDPISRYAI